MKGTLIPKEWKSGQLLGKKKPYESAGVVVPHSLGVTEGF